MTSFEVQPPKWTWWPIPRRYLVAVLGFFGFVHVYLLRVNMSFAIVAMTANHSIVDPINGTVSYVSCVIASFRDLQF